MKEINPGKDKIEKKVLQTEEQKIETYDDITRSKRDIETFDDIAHSPESPKGIETFDDIASSSDSHRKIETFDLRKSSEKTDKKYENEKQINKILEKTDPYWKEADERTAAAQKEFEKRGDWRQEFSRDVGKEEHKKWQDEIIERETKSGRIKGVDYDIEPSLTHPDGEKVYPDYVDYREDIIVDRKPIGKNESEFSVIKKYAEQRKRHIEAYEHSTGRKVKYYVYSLYPSPKDIY